MSRLVSLALTLLIGSASLHAQTTDLVFFTDDGAKFTLLVDGDQKNAAPATRVVATGIRTESPVVIVRFEDAAIPQIKKGGYFPLGMEYTVMITTNKKGERVFRSTGQAALGTAAQAEPAKPVTFIEDAPSTTTTTTVVEDEPVSDEVITTTTTVTEKNGGGSGENVTMSVGVNGFGFDMNVNVDDDMDLEGSGTTTTTTHTTTTTTRSSSSSSGTVTPTPTPIPPSTKPVKEPEVYHMPGYSGPIGCGWPMSASEFGEAKTSIEGKSFEESKMTTAKQIGRDRCFTVDQVKGIMGTFSFEDTKLEFAKYAYDRTYDIGNYYKVNDAFTFESSIDELNTYIQSR